VEDVPPVLDDREAGRKRERMERLIGGEGDGTVCDGGVHEEELATKKRLWAEVNVGDGDIAGWSRDAPRRDGRRGLRVPSRGCAEATTTFRASASRTSSRVKCAVLCYTFAFTFQVC
jgi:hypothetical protein